MFEKKNTENFRVTRFTGLGSTFLPEITLFCNFMISSLGSFERPGMYSLKYLEFCPCLVHWLQVRSCCPKVFQLLLCFVFGC